MMMHRLAPILAIVQRRRMAMLLTLIVGLFGAAAIVTHLPKVYGASALVLIVSERDGRDPSVSSIDLPSVATSTAVLEAVRKRLNLSTPLIDLKRQVKASVSARSSIMEISYRDKNPDAAVAIPNALAVELSHYYEQIATARADVDVARLDVEITAARDRLRAANRQLVAEAARRPFLNSVQALDTLTSRIDTLGEQSELAAAQLQSDIATAQASSPGSPFATKIARREILQGDPYYARVADGTARDEATLAFDRAQYKSRFPGVHSLTRKVAAEQAALQVAAQRLLSSPSAFSVSEASQSMAFSKAQAVVAGDRSRLTALDKLLSVAQLRLEELPRASADSVWLRTQRDAAQSDYLTLSSRRTTALANRAEALSLGSVVVFDRAVKAETAKVGLGRTALAVVMLALVIGLVIGIAMLLEATDSRLLRVDQIERLYGTPLVVTLGQEVS